VSYERATADLRSLVDVVAAHERPDEEFGRETSVLRPRDVPDDRTAVRTHSSSDVTDAPAHQEAREERERAVSLSVERRHRVRTGRDAVAADHVRPGVDGREKLRQRLHRIGVVAVGRDDDGAVGREHGCSHRDTVPLWLLLDDASAVLACHLGRPVVGPVDADDVRLPVGHPVDVLEDGPDGGRFVVGAHHDAEVLESVLLGGAGVVDAVDGQFVVCTR